MKGLLEERRGRRVLPRRKTLFVLVPESYVLADNAGSAHARVVADTIIPPARATLGALKMRRHAEVPTCRQRSASRQYRRRTVVATK